MLALLLLALVCFTQLKATQIKTSFPPVGDFIEVDGMKVHYIDINKGGNDDVALVFLHGASGNLRDANFVYRDKLQDVGRMIFFDRPGHGWSERKSDTLGTVKGQVAHTIKLLDALGIKKAIFVGHSWGGVLALSIGVSYPDRVAGLILNATVAYPWPGGINWYYPIAAMPVIGALFSHTLVMPVGLRQVKCATAKVFWPDPIPENYDRDVGTDMVLVPERFRANAEDIANLRAHVEACSPHYPEITAPVVVINGKKDQVVLPWVHAEQLGRTLSDVKVVDLPNSGHMPHHAHVDVMRDVATGLLEKA